MIDDIEINVDQMTTMIEKCASFQIFQLFENQNWSLLLIDLKNVNCKVICNLHPL